MKDESQVFFFYSIGLLQLPTTDGAKVNINRASGRFAIFVLNANEFALRIFVNIANGDRIVHTLRISIIKHVCAKSNIGRVLTILAHRRTSFSWFL
jgi:hypothetical protein